MVVFDGSRKLRSLPGAIGVLREGPQVGVYSICLDADERLLPAECQAVAAAGPDGALTVEQMSEPAIGEVRPEYATPAWADRLARSIAPVRDASGDDDAAGLPEACRLLDVLGLEPAAATAIAARWQAGGRSTLAVIGACYDGPFGVDLRKDGPRALIAGTTGTGKSELLQTMIASLARARLPLRRGRHRQPLRSRHPGRPAGQHPGRPASQLRGPPPQRAGPPGLRAVGPPDPGGRGVRGCRPARPARLSPPPAPGAVQDLFPERTVVRARVIRIAAGNGKPMSCPGP